MPVLRMTKPQPGRTLVTGGARSGKSAWAEHQLATAETVDYLATSEVRADDPEWVHRVELHRQRRPGHWRTIETLDIATELRRNTSTPLLMDCVAVWLARVLDEVDAWTRPYPDFADALTARTAELVNAVQTSTRDVIIVTNEVGWGLVPESPGTRLYRDELGRLNAQLAATCDNVWICIAGIARQLK